MLHRAFSYIPYFNQQNELIYNIKDNKTHLISGVNAYMFRHQGAIIREFINNEGP
jgi:hypothetical protein